MDRAGGSLPTRQAAGAVAAARIASPRGAPSAASRARSPLPGEAAASGAPSPGRGAGSSPSPFVVGAEAVPSPQQTRQDSNPDSRGWSSLCSRLHHGLVKRTARIERASSEWRSDALPAELRPRDAAQSHVPGTTRKPPAGFEPAPRPYKGRVLAVDTTEAKWRRSESNRHLPRCKRGARPVELHPRDADGWSRTTTARSDRVTAC